MNGPLLYPLQFEEVYKEKVWGGRNLEKVLGKALPPGQMIGESWEITEEGMVRNGLYRGRTLQALTAELGIYLLGERVTSPHFPLLTKFIDSQEVLSVQVHPDDQYALEKEGEPFGKTEAWYVIHAEPGAGLIHGFKDRIDAGEMKLAIEEGRLGEHLYDLEVIPGDVVFVPAGTVHAIKPGLVLFEIQQSSDQTYRIYDWNRVGLDGKLRPLHVEKALEVTDFGLWRDHKVKSITVREGDNSRTYLVACRYFVLELWELEVGQAGGQDQATFRLYSLLEGKLAIEYGAGKRLEVGQGQSVLIPAYIGRYVVRPVGKARLLCAYVPELWTDVIQPLLDQGFARDDIVRLGGEGIGNDLPIL